MVIRDPKDLNDDAVLARAVKRAMRRIIGEVTGVENDYVLLVDTSSFSGFSAAPINLATPRPVIEGILPMGNGGFGVDMTVDAVTGHQNVGLEIGVDVAAFSHTHGAASLDDGDYGDFTMASGVASLDAGVVGTDELAAGAVTPAKLADADFGAFTVASGVASLDASVVDTTQLRDGGVSPAKLQDADFGDFTVSAGVATLDAGVVDTAELADGAVTPAKMAERHTYCEGSESGDPVRTVCSNTTSWETVTSFALPADTTTDWLRTLKVIAEVYNNSGSALNLRWRVVLGSTTLHDSQASVATDADIYGMLMDVDLAARGSTAKQVCIASLLMAGAYTAGSGYGNWGAYYRDGTPWGTSAEDMTSSKTLSIDMRWTTADPSTHVKLYSSHLTLVPGS